MSQIVSRTGKRSRGKRKSILQPLHTVANRPRRITATQKKRSIYQRRAARRLNRTLNKRENIYVNKKASYRVSKSIKRKRLARLNKTTARLSKVRTQRAKLVRRRTAYNNRVNQRLANYDRRINRMRGTMARQNATFHKSLRTTKRRKKAYKAYRRKYRYFGLPSLRRPHRVHRRR